MRIFVEGEKYEIALLESIFDDSKFYFESGNKGIIKYVGYYKSLLKNQIIYLLPKVFINEGLVFGKYLPSDLAKISFYIIIKHQKEYLWIRQILVYFYNSLSVFKRKYPDNAILEKSQTLELNTNLGIDEYSYVDLMLAFTNFYKKYKYTILYHHIEYISIQAKKPKWEKTIRKSLPLFENESTPIYLEIRNKKKSVNSEEELTTYFFSILNNFNVEHSLYLKIDKSYTILKGNRFSTLQKNGLTKLRQIKYRYFSDNLKRMYQLCELYFSKTDTSSIKRKKEEFISVKNYNIIFEDMVDKLFSDKLDNSVTVKSTSFYDLKYNKDGKIIDHIYEYQSLIDNSKIFYIGDSKYYKSETEAGELSKYKQFTYAKNVIQFNIDLLNIENHSYNDYIRYRDTDITEGYNISPNFFLYGYTSDLTNFKDSLIEPYKNPITSFHFKYRLFDRDTLFVHQYKINFLFVLKSYSRINIKLIEDFRTRTREMFRYNFLKFFNNQNECGFQLYEKYFKESDLKDFVTNNFKLLNGKCISINNEILVIAKHKNDNSLEDVLKDFNTKTLI